MPIICFKNTYLLSLRNNLTFRFVAKCSNAHFWLCTLSSTDRQEILVKQMFVTAGGILFLFRSSPHPWTAGGKLKEKTKGAKYRMFGLSPFFERLSLTGCILVVWHHNTKRSWIISMYTVSHDLFSFHRLLHSNAIKKIDVRAFAGLHELKSLWVLYYNWINFLVVGGGHNPIIYLILSNVYLFFLFARK